MRGRPLHAAAAAATVAGIAALVAARGPQVAAALAALPWPPLAAAALLHMVTLACRSEAWAISLGAVSGERMPRRPVHAANGAAFAAGSLVTHCALPVRIAVVRRLAPSRAPRIGQIAIADVPILLLELIAAAGVLAAAALVGASSPWLALGAALLGAAALFAARRAADRFAHRSLAGGLAILSDLRRRAALAALVATITVLTVARLDLLLAAGGLPYGPGEVAALFCAAGVLGLLPLGVGASPAAALATAGASGLAAALAVGLAIAATSVIGVLLYGAVVLAWQASAAWRGRGLVAQPA